MSLTSIFFKKKQQTEISRTIANQQVPAIVLDATVKESFSATAEPTQHPVEDGADVTDHVILRPSALTISGMITENPFSTFQDLLKAGGATVASAVGASLGSFGGAAGSAVGGVAGAIGGASLAGAIFGSGDRDLSAVALEFLQLRDARQPVSIQTGLRLYKSYILSSFTLSKDPKTGGSINVDLEFKELILVESQTTQVAIPKVPGGIRGSNLGRQSKEGLTGDETTQGSSLLKQFAPSFLGGT